MSVWSHARPIRVMAMPVAWRVLAFRWGVVAWLRIFALRAFAILNEVGGTIIVFVICNLASPFVPAIVPKPIVLTVFAVRPLSLAINAFQPTVNAPIAA